MIMVPKPIVRLFQVNFQFTLSLPSVLLSILLIGFSIFFLIRYKYLTKYSNNPASGLPSNEIKKEVLVDSINKKRRKNLNSNTNYLDEFLSAIKIFGYLERLVFHELTKNMTTQRLSWDEILYLDEKLGFLIVVDGAVQIFIKVNENYNKLNQLKDLENDRDEVLIIGNQKYQLLNEIKSGTPLSSLNSTIDLFNPEDIDTPLFQRSNSSAIDDSPIPKNSSSTSSLDLNEKQENPNTPPENEDDIGFSTSYPEIVARPKSSKNNRRGATIAIIPASAFQRIQIKYPKATAHIVTMVKNRLFKVTMNTIHNYLGLSDEILDSEVQLNSLLKNTLPTFLKETLLEKYLPSKNGNNVTKDEFTRVASKNRHRKHKSIDLQVKSSEKSSTRLVSLSSIQKPNHPGDLLSSVPISRKSLFNVNDSFRDPFNKHSSSTLFSNEGEETEDTSTRVAIIENIFKLIGLSDDNPLLQKNDTWGNLSLINSSVSSPSMVGLSHLANSNLETIPFGIKPVNKNKIYDDYASRNRFDSFSSVSSSSASRGTSPKLYDTINQSQLSNYNRTVVNSHSNGNMSGSELIHKLSSASQLTLFDLNNVKAEYAKILKIKYFEPGETVIEQDSYNSGLYYVVEGSLDSEYSTTGKDNKAKARKRRTFQLEG